MKNEPNNNSAAAASAQSGANARLASAPTESFEVNADGSVTLTKPLLRLQGHIMFKLGDTRTHQNEWRPERAVIAAGLVIIEEWGVVIPLSYIQVGYYGIGVPAPKAAAS